MMEAASLLAMLGALSAVGALALRVDASGIARIGVDRGPFRRSRAEALATIGSLPLLRRIPVSERTESHLASAGGTLRGRHVIGAKALLASLLLVVGVVGHPLALVLLPLAVRVPDIVIARRTAHRLADIDREVPVLLDLLAVAISAGTPPQLALRRAAEVAEGPLADELRAVARATDLGGRWRAELALVSRRLDLPDLARLLATLTRAEALGSALSEEISRLAADVREARRAASTERARAAPVKMLFPLVFLVLPAFLLLTVVPVLVATVESIR